MNTSGKWKRTIVKAPELVCTKGSVRGKGEISPNTIQALQQGLKFEYPYPNATITPSKQTATQLKGRDKDQEAAENAGPEEFVHHSWRKPSFVDRSKQSTSRGTAMHAVMQYIRFDQCTTVSSIEAEVHRIANSGYISLDAMTEISVEQIAAFFSTEIGQRMINEKEKVLREFKFSILVNSEECTGLAADDKMLLQGVVDSAIIEPDGITVVDFKSDKISEKDLDNAVSRYRLQVKSYANALSRIYRLPIKSAQLYFFQLNCFVSVI